MGPIRSDLNGKMEMIHNIGPGERMAGGDGGG